MLHHNLTKDEDNLLSVINDDSDFVGNVNLSSHKDDIIECLGGLKQIINLCLTNPNAKNVILAKNIEKLNDIVADNGYNTNKPIQNSDNIETCCKGHYSFCNKFISIV